MNSILQKIFFFSLFFFFFILNCSAQSKINIGAHLNGIRTNAYNDGFIELLENKPKYSISGGLSLQNNFHRYFSFTVGINYLNLSNKLSDWESDGINDLADVKINAKLNYFQVPFLLDFNILQDRKLFITSGVYMSQLHKGEIKGTIEGDQIDYLESKYDEDITKDLSNIDYGFVFGIGSQIPYSEKLIINLGLNYNYGNLVINENNDIYPDYRLYNRFLILKVGINYILN